MDYGLDSPGIESRRESDFFTSVHPDAYQVFPWDKEGGKYCWRSAPSSAEVRNVLELYLRFTYPPSYACHVVTLTFTPTYLQYIWHGDKYLHRLKISCSKYPHRRRGRT